ncbi:MAG: hypothetical protein SP4CHLAM5_08120 [Chlamydiia bacterium]|nr:hypothetical protein [Chlamydiia bacterium]MCH9618675.1 hypothetical protein [Chlamydiia bacterium]MCH9624422.1 hypothetical protein [Chlamydiia bacterium]
MIITGSTLKQVACNKSVKEKEELNDKRALLSKKLHKLRNSSSSNVLVKCFNVIAKLFIIIQLKLTPFVLPTKLELESEKYSFL